ncbi:MAG: NUDIX hydrolase [Cyclobacteriaceae bacterium]
MSSTYSYPRPALTADAVVICKTDKTVLLIQRKKEPFIDQWALPGGFVGPYEEPFKACLRELTEETQLDLKETNENLIGVFGKKGRDPRGWIISVAYFFMVEQSEKSLVQAGSDSKNVKWIPLDQVQDLAFDHEVIIPLAVRTFF